MRGNVACGVVAGVAMTGVQHWQDSEGKWWHAINQAGKGHPADPAHRFEVVDMPCDCPVPPEKGETGPVFDAS